MTNEKTLTDALDIALESRFNARNPKMQWLDMELMLVDILRSSLSDANKVKYSKIVIDAFTKRGHFTNNY